MKTVNTIGDARALINKAHRLWAEGCADKIVRPLEGAVQRQVGDGEEICWYWLNHEANGKYKDLEKKVLRTQRLSKDGCGCAGCGTGAVFLFLVVAIGTIWLACQFA